MAGRVADALDAGNLGDELEQGREVGDLAVAAHRAAVGIDVLAEQGDLAHALVGQAGDLGQHVVERPRHFLAAGVGNDAVGAVLGAAFHDRDEGASAPSTRAGGRWSNFSISGKLMSTCGRCSLFAPRQHRRQAVQGLRSEHQVDVGRALDDRRAFLAGDAAADADQRALVLQVLDPAEVAEHLVLGLLAHRAGVEQDQVGLVDVVGRLVARGGVQHVGHLVRVVDVHLAAEGLDEDLRLRARDLASRLEPDLRDRIEAPGLRLPAAWSARAAWPLPGASGSRRP